MASAKRRKSAAPAAVATTASAATAAALETSPRRQTRSCANASTRSTTEAANEGAVQSALAFLEARDFRGAEHAALLYRLDAGSPRRSLTPIKEKEDSGNGQFGSDPVADALGFPSPFQVLNMADRKGIWQSTPPLVKELGEDPQKERRQVLPVADGRDAVAPAGLKNLGATCYLNSLLQYLFFNTDFRRGLLEAPSSSAVVRALQEVFILLARGHRSVVDTAAFVSAAGLEAGEQEDATEFSTLLLDWLQRELGQGKGDAGGSFIPELFEGEISQILSCMEHPEHTFERREPFFELRARLSPSSGAGAPPVSQAPGKGGGARAAASVPPIGTVVGVASACEQAEPGAPTTTAVSKNRPAGPGGKRPSGSKKKSAAQPPVIQLEQLLADTAFPDEMLDGSNQYHCPKCDRKVDARKSLRLAKPPPYLHVTVERYHYDLQKGEREKLLNPVSFPQHLQLRPCGGASREVASSPVTYECIGYLEHVSDSAHSGHYTATLYQEEEDAAEALALAAEAALPSLRAGDDAVQSCSAGDPAAEPAPKRQRCCITDAAAGEPRRGVWWTLDDTQASPAQWPQTKPAADRAASATEPCSSPNMCSAPPRIESSSAYLILYRRSDRARCGEPQVPASLAAHCAGANSEFAEEQREFARRSRAVTAFVAERRQAATALAQALRQVAASGGANGGPDGLSQSLSVVPTSWLQAFLRGEDRRVVDLLDGDTQLLAPVLYGRALLRAPADESAGGGLALDPLAVWTGEVKLVPTCVLAAVGGRGGLDPSLFLEADELSVAPAVCEKAWRLVRLYIQEWMQTGKIVHEGKISITDARGMQAAGRGTDAVWVSLRVQRLWQKAVGASSTVGSAGKAQPPWQVAALRAFLAEVHAVRWADLAETARAAEAPAEGAEEQGAGAEAPAGAAAAPQQPSPPAPSAQARAAQRCEVSLTAGLLCPHGMVCRPKAGFLCRRSEVERLLELAAAKERAYRDLWPDARAVPRLRTGTPGGDLLVFGDSCTECRGDCADTGGAATTTLARRRLIVRRRYPSGVRRKAGVLAIPEGEGPVTGACLRGLVQDQLSLPVAKLHVVHGAGADGTEVELRDADPMGEGVDHIIVEKDEGVQPAVEAAAFQGSVFRAPAGRGAAAAAPRGG